MAKGGRKILFAKEEIEGAVSNLAAVINKDYENKKVLMVGILKGAFVFMSDLIRKLDLDISVDFVVLRSYGSGTTSSGEVEMKKDLEGSIEGKDVLIVEDIVDTGITLRYLRDQLLLRGPKSLKICALLDKKARREVEIDVDYVGLEMTDGFVVGYGLDCDEKYRNLPEIWVLDEE
jgi:hypoxanthine phosphoribosyltransferase